MTDNQVNQETTQDKLTRLESLVNALMGDNLANQGALQGRLVHLESIVATPMPDWWNHTDFVSGLYSGNIVHVKDEIRWIRSVLGEDPEYE